MKKYSLLLLTAFALFAGCVQPTVEKTVLVQLVVRGKVGIKTVGIRGDGNPLSWDEDHFLEPVVVDSLYETSFKSRTGFLYTEYKFTVDGVYEWKGDPARRIYYKQAGDTILVRAVFGERE